MKKLVFSCKDPKVAAHHERVFAAAFAEELDEVDQDWVTHLKGDWAQRMRTESARQEHFDYVLECDGSRTPLRPLLLVPDVEVRDR